MLEYIHENTKHLKPGKIKTSATWRGEIAIDEFNDKTTEELISHIKSLSVEYDANFFELEYSRNSFILYYTTWRPETQEEFVDRQQILREYAFRSYIAIKREQLQNINTKAQKIEELKKKIEENQQELEMLEAEEIVSHTV